MSFAPEDRATERDRYDRRARELLTREQPALSPDGAASQPLVIRRPYLVYEDFIRLSVTPGADALDVCCGTGLYSLIAAQAGARATASDIAPANLALASQRARRAGIELRTAVANAEQLPFPAGSFDLVTCAGSLSYVDLDTFLAEVRRVLRPGGSFVCIDSLNHNPIYRLNRYIQYRRGRRSRSTIERMPTLGTIAGIDRVLAVQETSFHGIATFAAPLLKPLAGEDRTARWLDDFDSRFPELRRWAFKLVLRARRRD